MKYKIEGGNLPVVICELEAGETLITEGGAMSWMSPNIRMETTSNGGVGKGSGQNVFGRKAFSEQIYSRRRRRNDCICIKLSGFNQSL